MMAFDLEMSRKND